MIYFVTGQRELFEFPDAKYKCISVEESLRILEPLRIGGLDTETTGTEIWQGKLLTLQLGNKENQVVIDCTTIDVKQYKNYLESDRLFIIHNAKFDLRWLYKEHIVVRNVYDTYLAEKILYLGFPPGIISLSLQACCDRYLNVFLDKTVRGKIHVGMTEDVIVYAANDVVYLEDIMNSQLPIISARSQRVALDIENEFVRVLAYIEFCGIRLDPEKWKAKMAKDAERLRIAEQKLNEWVVDYVMKKNDPSLIASNYDSHKKGKPAKLADSVYVVIPAPSLFSEFDTGPQCIINWNSSKQVIRLFEELGFDLLVKDKKTGKMKKSVESKYIELQADKSTIVPLYLEYSAAFKVVTSFGQNFLDAINPVTHRIHPTFNQMMDTGRLSCGSGGKGKGGKTKDDDIAEEGELGRIIVTDLYNKAMPMIRYDTGDLGIMTYVTKNGEKGKFLAKIEGRSNDFLFSTKGELLSPVTISVNMWKFIELKQYQFIQTGRTNFKIKIVCDSNPYTRESELITDIKNLVGAEANIDLIYEEDIPLLKSGKRKYVINEMQKN